MSSRMLSLAAGTVLDLGPASAVQTAAQAGWPAVGIWFDASTWTSAVAAAVSGRLADTGTLALDIEPMILGIGWTHASEMIEAAAAIGARHLLVASGPASRQQVIDELGAVAAEALQSCPTLTVVLEFLPIFTIATLHDAAGVIAEVGSANLGVLVDTLHLARSGGHPDDLVDFDQALFPYLQLADATAQLEMDSLREEALHGRLLPGHGALPLLRTLQRLPDKPVSVELRSRRLNRDFPHPLERARHVLHATQQIMEQAQTSHDSDRRIATFDD